MKIKYRNKVLRLNYSPYCVECDIYRYTNDCLGLCGHLYVPVGFSIVNNYEVLEL